MVLSAAACGGMDAGAEESTATESAGLVGTWTQLPGNPVDNGAITMMLLTDGSVLVGAGGDQHLWTQLKPDAFGNYATEPGRKSLQPPRPALLPVLHHERWPGLGRRR